MTVVAVYMVITLVVLACLYLISELVLWGYFRRKRKFFKDLEQCTTTRTKRS